MAEDLIRYDILAQDALRGVVRKVLSEVARTGLPGEHHFYVTFNTKAPGVRISSRLMNEYPEEMTIILQHQFWDLAVSESSFEVGLSFHGIPERLLVPFSAVKAFVDPSVQFALQFETMLVAPQADEKPVAAEPKKTGPTAVPAKAKQPSVPAPLPAVAAKPVAVPNPKAEPVAKPAAEAGAAVVSLDSFRKKS